MKKQIVIALATVLSFASANAAPAARSVAPEALRKGISDYEAVVKKYVFGKETADAKGLAPQAEKIVEEKIGKQLDVKDNDLINLRSAMGSSEKNSAAVIERRLDQLVSLVAARKITKAMIDKGQADENIESMLKATDAMTKTITNSVFTRYKTKSTILKADELADASLALDKLESLPSQVLKMEVGERENYVAVELKRADILKSNPSLAGEEALVQAIMEVRNVDKDEAMKIVRRMKDCV